jgi:hypothetical protein
MNSVYKLLCLATAFMVSSSSFADSSTAGQSNNNSSMMKKQMNAPLFEQGMGLPANKYPAAYNAPASICLKNGWDFDVFGSFIYWHASQDYMDIAYVVAVPTASATTAVPATVAFQNVNYEPGFKIGFGFNTNYDGWVFRGEYTWLHQTVTTPAITAPVLPSGAAGTWSAPSWFTLANTGAAVSSSWKMHLDMVDAVFERPFYEGMMLTVTPYGGLRGLWVRQNFNIDFLNAAGVVTSYCNNHSGNWSVGPTTGVGGHWLLGSGFRFEGNAGASILYTQFTKITHTEQDSGLLSLKSGMTDLNVLRPIGQLAVGLGWGSYFCNNGFYLDISADYEFLYLWEQNVIREWAGLIQGNANAVADLQLHGLTATVRFDF